jgi:hypothetical protein
MPETPCSGSGPGGRWFESTRPDQSFQSLPRNFWFLVYTAVDTALHFKQTPWCAEMRSAGDTVITRSVLVWVTNFHPVSWHRSSVPPSSAPVSSAPWAFWPPTPFWGAGPIRKFPASSDAGAAGRRANAPCIVRFRLIPDRGNRRSDGPSAAGNGTLGCGHGGHRLALERSDATADKGNPRGKLHGSSR